MLNTLRNRTFRHLFAAQVIALLGTGLATVALGLLAWQLAGEDAGLVLGAALAIKMIAYVTLAPIAAAIATRLKRAEGHLRRVIGMIEEGRPCVELATQLHAVERAVAEAKRAMIHDHIDHCVTAGGDHNLAEIKALTKLL